MLEQSRTFLQQKRELEQTYDKNVIKSVKLKSLLFIVKHRQYFVTYLIIYFYRKQLKK